MNKRIVFAVLGEGGLEGIFTTKEKAENAISKYCLFDHNKRFTIAIRALDMPFLKSPWEEDDDE